MGYNKTSANHPLIKNVHPPLIYPKYTSTCPYSLLSLHKKCPNTPTHPKYSSTYPHPPIKVFNHPYPPIKMSNHPHPSKIYPHSPPFTHKKCPPIPSTYKKYPLIPNSTKIYLQQPPSTLEKCLSTPIYPKYSSTYPQPPRN